MHLSDTHLVGSGQKLSDRYRVEETLAKSLAVIENLGVDPDAIVVSGDLTDRGLPEEYRLVRQMVEPVAERLSAPVIWLAGNHDDRPAFRQELLDQPASQKPVTGVWDLGGLRLIALDSSVPGWHHGEIDQEQLEWLRSLLSEPAPLGTIVAVHHPPLPSHVPSFDVIELQNQDELAEVIAGSDVRGILSGHLHYSCFGMFAGVPVSVAQATSNNMNITLPAVEVAATDAAQGFHLVHVYDHTVTFSVVPLAEAPTEPPFPTGWVQALAQLTPEERRERFSRKSDQDFSA